MAECPAGSVPAAAVPGRVAVPGAAAGSAPRAVGAAASVPAAVPPAAAVPDADNPLCPLSRFEGPQKIRQRQELSNLNGLNPVLHRVQAVSFSLNSAVDAIGNSLFKLLNRMESLQTKPFCLAQAEEIFINSVIQSSCFSRHAQCNAFPLAYQNTPFVRQ